MSKKAKCEEMLTIQLTAPELTLVVCLLRQHENAETKTASRAKQKGSLRQAMARCQSAIQACELGTRLDRIHRKGLAVFLLLCIILAGQSAFADYVELVRKAKPAVVEIDVVTDEGFSSGTGFFVSSDGYLVTNAHVLAGARRKSDVTVTGIDGTLYVFRGRAYHDDNDDIAILKCDCPSGCRFSYLLPDPYDDVAEGETVLVIGNPEGLTGTVSNGLVAAIRKDPHLIQITAPISFGSSGSPVLNEDGLVIGVAAEIFKEGQNLNFAIPAAEIIKGLAAIPGFKIDPTAPSDRTSHPRALPARTPVQTQEEAEHALNIAYQALRSSFDPRSRELLRQEENEWLKQRDRFKHDPDAFLKATMARVYLLQNGLFLNAP